MRDARNAGQSIRVYLCSSVVSKCLCIEPNKTHTIALMDDVELAIVNAWHAPTPTLARDPDELARRLARRDRIKLLGAPPRAGSPPPRASDTRLENVSRRGDRATREYQVTL